MKNKIIVLLLLCIFLGIFLLTRTQIKNIPGVNVINTSNVQNTPAQTSSLYQVTRVIDGDTIEVTINGTVEKVRLIGIDTPEVVDPRRPVQCFGIEASNHAKQILTGKQVMLVSDPTQSNRDKYGRLLRYVFLPDGTNFNKMMIEQGYAFEYTYHSNPYMYQSEFQQAQRDARENNRGLWASTTCNGRHGP